MDDPPVIQDSGDDAEGAGPNPIITEDIAYGDPAPSIEEEQKIESAAPDLPIEDEDATAVLRVCRNELNTINTHPTGFHWFSA